MVTSVDFPNVLPDPLLDFLAHHPDAIVTALVEPSYRHVPLEHPQLSEYQSDVQPTLAEEDYLLGLDCIRRARHNGTSHTIVPLDGIPTHLSVVALVGSPISVLVFHKTAGIGELSEQPLGAAVPTLSGTLNQRFEIETIAGDTTAFASCDKSDLIGVPLESLVSEASVGLMMDAIVETHRTGTALCNIELVACVGASPHRLTLLRTGDHLSFSIVDREAAASVFALSNEQNGMNELVDSVHHGLFRVSHAGSLLYKNVRLDEIFGRTFETFSDFGEIRTTGGARLVEIVPDELKANEECVVDVSVDVHDRSRMIRLRINATKGSTGRLEYVGSAEDVTELLKRELKLEQDALTDPMTGVANRRGWEIAVTRQLDAVPFRSFAVLLCDLDGFKQVNDSLGHDAGDKVIAEVGKRLSEASRDHDLVARLGGDEFVVVANEISDYDEAMEFAERILPRLRQPYMI